MLRDSHAAPWKAGVVRKYSGLVARQRRLELPMEPAARTIELQHKIDQ
jgi:hypothetical protein